MAFNLDWGTEEGAAPGGGSATWWGASGYVRWSVSPAFALALRAEHFDDADGVRTGVVQELREVTLTPEVRVGPHLEQIVLGKEAAKGQQRLVHRTQLVDA